MGFHRILLLVSLVVVIALAGCTNPVSNIRQDTNPDITKLDNQKAAQTCSQPQYFFINGSLLGSYDENRWYSLCDTGGFEKKAGDAVAELELFDKQFPTKVKKVTDTQLFK